MIRQKYKLQAKTRSDLLTLLSEAAEIEHALVCSYLYTAFSLKSKNDDKLSWENLHIVKKWAGQIFFVASQEMLHLAQVWNLISAIGGTPSYERPNFPIKSKYFHFDLPVSLKPFSEETLKLFEMYELPQELSEKDYVKKVFNCSFEDGYDYKTVGELYELIKNGIKNIPESELFIGDVRLQADSDIVDFPNIVKVTNQSSALAAIDMIIEQGEGCSTKSNNSHYGVFKSILDEFKALANEFDDFEPCYPVVENPAAYHRRDHDEKRVTYLENEVSVTLADIFDDLYVLMMQLIQVCFASVNKRDLKSLSKFSIHIMPSVLKPLADILMQLPATKKLDSNAGPGFLLARHSLLQDSPSVTYQVINDRFQEIQLRLIKLDEENEDLLLTVTIETLSSLHREIIN